MMIIITIIRFIWQIPNQLNYIAQIVKRIYNVGRMGQRRLRLNRASVRGVEPCQNFGAH
jgi:hypothetical protein